MEVQEAIALLSQQNMGHLVIYFENMTYNRQLLFASHNFFFDLDGEFKRSKLSRIGL